MDFYTKYQSTATYNNSFLRKQVILKHTVEHSWRQVIFWATEYVSTIFFFLIIRSMFLDHSGITLEMNNRKITRESLR